MAAKRENEDGGSSDTDSMSDVRVKRSKSDDDKTYAILEEDAKKGEIRYFHNPELEGMQFSKDYHRMIVDLLDKYPEARLRIELSINDHPVVVLISCYDLIVADAQLFEYRGRIVDYTDLGMIQHAWRKIPRAHSESAPTTFPLTMRQMSILANHALTSHVAAWVFNNLCSPCEIYGRFLVSPDTVMQTMIRYHLYGERSIEFAEYMNEVFAMTPNPRLLNEVEDAALIKWCREHCYIRPSDEHLWACL